MKEVILAGGRSSRFGSDKARLIVHGQPLLRHVAAMLEPVVASITVVADRAGKYDDVGFRTVADRQPGLGPLGGLDTALHDLPSDYKWLLLCSCDAVIIRRVWLNHLLDVPNDGHDAVAFKANRWQPMPALYAVSAQQIIATCLASGNRSMQRLLDQLSTTPQPLPPDWPDNWQINTPQDLNRHLTNDV